VDVVTIGDATLYHGDCREILPALPKADAVVTDPPYGVYAVGGSWGNKKDLAWDKKPATNVKDVVAMGDASIVWGGNYFELPPSRGWLVWYKRDSNLSAADCELAWTSMDMNCRLIDQSIAATNAERCGHPTQKPLAVMEWCLSFLPTAQTILDPYMGSGTTGVACANLGKQFVGIEIERKYFDMACTRISAAYAQGRLFA
jgi:site-specific DNA-methyltransferase (adenine-specific)